MDAASTRLIEEWAAKKPYLYADDLFSGPFRAGAPKAGVGVRRVLLGSSVGYRLGTSYGYAEVHADGAALASGRIDVVATDSLPRPVPDDPEERKFTVTALTLRVAGCLRAAASASLEVGAFGDCAVIVGLHGKHLRLVEYEHAHFEHKIGDKAIDGPLHSRHTVTLESLASMSPDLLIATRQVCADLVQAFGAPELATITSDGHPLLSAFPSGYHQQLANWSERTGIALAY